MDTGGPFRRTQGRTGKGDTTRPAMAPGIIAGGVRSWSRIPHCRACACHRRSELAAGINQGAQAAKARGKRLGNPKLEKARQQVFKANREAAQRFAANVLPLIHQIQASGVQSLRGVARALTARGIKTARGGEWAAEQVADILR